MFMKYNTIKSRLVATILTGIVVLGTPLYIVAEDEDLTNQLDSIQQQVNQQNSIKADAETVIVSVSEQLRQIEEQLRQAQQQLESIQQQRVAVENDITVNEKLLAEAQKRLEGRESVFYKRVRDIYINGRLSYLDVVIGSKDFSDFANRLEILKRIIDADIKLIDEIKKSGELRIAVFGDKKPFGYVDNDGSYQGYDIELGNQLAQDLGVKVKYVSVDAANRAEYLISNKVDITLANFTVTDERKKQVDFALPYMKVSLGVVSPKTGLITDVKQLEGKTLIVTKGTTAETYFEKNHSDFQISGLVREFS